MELWKRYSAELIHNWGLSDYTKRLEPERPQYLEYMKKFAGEEYQAKCYTDPPRPLRYIYSYSVTILGVSSLMNEKQVDIERRATRGWYTSLDCVNV